MREFTDRHVIRVEEEADPVALVTQRFRVFEGISEPGTYPARMISVTVEALPLVWEGDDA